jgi:hypothetical protein
VVIHHALWRHRYVIPVEPDNVVLENAAVAVKGGKIVAVTSQEEARALFTAVETVRDHHPSRCTHRCARILARVARCWQASLVDFLVGCCRHSVEPVPSQPAPVSPLCCKMLLLRA